MTAWAAARSKLREQNSNFFTQLSNTERYKDIAIEMEDTINPDGSIRPGLISRAKDREMLPPIEHPAREILNAYYSIKLETKLDIETGNIVQDWDTYFLKIDTILNALNKANRQDMADMITQNMTDLEKLRWEVYRKYFRGYNRRQQAILTTQFDEVQQAQIRAWIQGSPQERVEIEAIVDEHGQSLVGSYRQQTRTTGENLRKLSPELDGWLLFFEITNTTLTDAGQSYYSQFRKEWGIPE